LDASKGYYVRSLARDLSAALGTIGHLTALRRTRSGPFLISEAVNLDAPPEDLEARIVPLDAAAARALPALRLTATGARDAGFGRRVAATEMEFSETRGPGVYAWLGPDGRLVAIGEVGEDGGGRVVRGFARGEGPATSSSSRGS
jgi:tRNA pseudouridine55 synthase